MNKMRYDISDDAPAGWEPLGRLLRRSVPNAPHFSSLEVAESVLRRSEERAQRSERFRFLSVPIASALGGALMLLLLAIPHVEKPGETLALPMRDSSQRPASSLHAPRRHPTQLTLRMSPRDVPVFVDTNVPRHLLQDATIGEPPARRPIPDAIPGPGPGRR